MQLKHYFMRILHIAAINCYFSYEIIYKINLILIINKQQTTNTTSWTVYWLVA